MKNYAYITLLTNDEYLPVVLGLKASLVKNTPFPLICMVSYEVSDVTLQKLDKYKIEYKKFPTLSFPQQLVINKLSYYSKQGIPLDSFHDTLMKVWALSFHEYDKVIFLDADMFILSSIDHLFERPHFSACRDGGMIKEQLNQIHSHNSEMYDADFHDRLNAGLIVFEPTEENFESINVYLHQKLQKTHPTIIANDQELFSLYAEDVYEWSHNSRLHIPEYHNIFAPHMDMYLRVTNFDINDVKAFHFVGIKPTSYAVSVLIDWDDKDPITFPYVYYIKTLLNFLSNTMS